MLKLLTASIVLALAAPLGVQAADDAELAQIRQQMQQLREHYDARLAALETRLQQATAAPAAAKTALASAVQPTPTATANAFNPAISLVLGGSYAHLTQDPAHYRIAGFIPNGGEIGPGSRGFNLGESELTVAASIDPFLRGQFTLAVTPEDTVEVEEAYLQTLGLGRGFTVKAGRYLSGIGYLNAQHAHTWDFVDAPLAYQAFLGSQFSDDGVQLKWLAPTDTWLELGAEVGRGAQFPASDRGENAVGAVALFAHLGGDLGHSHSWRAGLSWLGTEPRERAYRDTDNFGVTVDNLFSGKSHLAGADFVWKWAPNGNASRRYFKLQGEYFHRSESGNLTYDSNAVSGGTNIDRYSANPSGGYVQAVYQFMPRWRVGLRWDQLDGGRSDYASNATALAQAEFNPEKNSLMLDYSPSEFSRFRLQVAEDKSRPEATDRQLFLQYITSLGAHSAHQY